MFLLKEWMEAAEEALRWGNLQPTCWAGYYVGESSGYIYVVPQKGRACYGPDEIMGSMTPDLRAVINLRVRCLRRHAALRPMVPPQLARQLRDFPVDGFIETVDGQLLVVVRNTTSFDWLPVVGQVRGRAVEAPVWCGQAGGFISWEPGRRMDYWWMTRWGWATTKGPSPKELAASISEIYRVPTTMAMAWIMGGEEVDELVDLAQLFG